MKTHTADPESDYSQRCMCVCVCVLVGGACGSRRFIVWGGRERVEGGWSKLHRDCSWERERQRGGRPTLSFFLRVGEERGRINRLICHARSHTHTFQTNKHTITQQPSRLHLDQQQKHQQRQWQRWGRETKRQRERERQAKRRRRQTLFIVWGVRQERERDRPSAARPPIYVHSDGRPHVPVCVLSVCAAVGGCVPVFLLGVCSRRMWWVTPRAWRASWPSSGPELLRFDSRCQTRPS